MEPTAPQERIQLLDVLRGFAIFGMFTVNMSVDLFWGDTFHEMNLGFADFWSVAFVDMFTNGKFITIFSLLFGIGFYLQFERASQRGVNFVVTHIRRAGGLLLIGLTAMALTLPAWILLDYAILGLFLLFFYKRTPRTILTAAIVCIIIGKLIGEMVPDYLEARELSALAAEQGVPVAEVVVPEDPEELAQEQQEELIFATGSLVEVSRASLIHLWDAFSNWRYYIANLGLIGILLLGLYLGARGAIWDEEERNHIAKKALPWLLGIGLTGALTYVVMQDFGVGDQGALAHKIIRELAFWPIGALSLGLAYAATITLLMQREAWRRRLTPFAAVGRLALTNYLITCFVVAVVSWTWGFGLYNKLMPLEGLLIVLLVYPLQVIASGWWMRHYRFGPCEWLWRSMTYGKLPPMRLKEVPLAT